MSGFEYSLKELQIMADQKAKALGFPPTEMAHLGGSFADRIQHLSTDSRRIHHPAKTLFVAIQTPTRSGEQYLSDAWDKGVRNYLVKKGFDLPERANSLKSPDTLKTMQCIAGAHRDKYQFPVLGITGSNGKTIVKEWLSTILDPEYEIVKSPKSFNSQIGVPLSLALMHAQANLGLIEAGISKVGEMEVLGKIIRPDDVILTHLGDAHAEGFASPEEKLAEKLLLVQPETHRIFTHSANPDVLKAVRKLGKEVLTVGTHPDDTLQIIDPKPTPTGWRFAVRAGTHQIEMDLNVTGKAALSNASIVMLVAHAYGTPLEAISLRLPRLLPISMRLEMITDNPEVTIINDAYNADSASILNAFSILANESNQPGRALILSDLEHQGQNQAIIQQEILENAFRIFRKEDVYLVGPVFHKLGENWEGVRSYASTDDFLANFNYKNFIKKVVLIKGARKFRLEQIIPYLSQRAIASWFSINLGHLSHNFKEFQRILSPGTKTIAMVKAFAYGSGTWEIAQSLEMDGVDYLAVAYTSEGISLRTRGIQTPIMVMNADENSTGQLFVHNLEAAVYDLKFLENIRRASEFAGEDYVKVHIKVDTGMRRLGFGPDDAQKLGEYLQQNPEIHVESVYSHLASADMPEFDAYTLSQIEAFNSFYNELITYVDYRPDRHVMNTAGVIRFPAHQMERVRLGIGLYGVAPVKTELDLREVGSLHAIITQIHAYPEGVPVGYGCSQVTERPSVIATLAIGYADGIRRSLSNGVGRFLVRGRRAPVFGRVCMDMLMLDVTDIPGARAGDEVVLIGTQGKETISVEEIAVLCDTIPYEILTGIGRRVRRLYVRE